MDKDTSELIPTSFSVFKQHFKSNDKYSTDFTVYHMNDAVEVFYKIEVIYNTTSVTYDSLRFFKHYFSIEELQFIESLMDSGDYSNYLIAKEIVNSKSK